MEFYVLKYMGSKRVMLGRGLGSVIAKSLEQKDRFVDLFSGSGAVACHVAETHPVRVLATDLQSFATALAAAVVARQTPLSFDSWAPGWIGCAIARAERLAEAAHAARLQNALKIESIGKQADAARQLTAASTAPYVRAYGGWYFSPWQALLLWALREEIPENAPWREVALAATIQAASKCAASPGHTAQPFKSDTRAAPFLLEAWKRDVIAQVTESAQALSARHAILAGKAQTLDANEAAKMLNDRDLVFLDPPYSSVHYSRFYHVLESLARGSIGEVTGSGRYPPASERPSSNYSIPTRAEQAFTNLLEKISDTGASAIITFPANKASNGLSGQQIKEIAATSFQIKDERVTSRFSTLGGDQRHREARQDTEEMILTMHPR